MEGKQRKPSAPVKGTVLLAGKPLPSGKINLEVSGQAPVVLEIRDGEFEGNVHAGVNRVEIRAFKDGPPLTTDPSKMPTKLNYLPEKYAGKSTLTTEIPRDGKSDLKFEVSLK